MVGDPGAIRHNGQSHMIYQHGLIRLDLKTPAEVTARTPEPVMEPDADLRLARRCA